MASLLAVSELRRPKASGKFGWFFFFFSLIQFVPCEWIDELRGEWMVRWMGEWRSLPVPSGPFLQRQHLGWAAGQKHGAKRCSLSQRAHSQS